MAAEPAKQVARRGEADGPGSARPRPEPRPDVPVKVAARDLVIFQIKLALDGLGDLVLAPVAVVAFLLDLIPRRRGRSVFYSVLRAGERWDRWLSLYRPANEAESTDEGLLGATRIDADTLLGKVEEIVKTKARPPEEPKSPL